MVDYQLFTEVSNIEFDTPAIQLLSNLNSQSNKFIITDI